MFSINYGTIQINGTSVYTNRRAGGNNDGATSKTANELKGLAATLGTAFTNDKVPNINSGYPILKWQL